MWEDLKSYIAVTTNYAAGKVQSKHQISAMHLKAKHQISTMHAFPLFARTTPIQPIFFNFH